MGRDGEIEVGGEGWFAAKEERWGGEGGDGKGVIRLQLRN